MSKKFLTDVIAGATDLSGVASAKLAGDIIEAIKGGALFDESGHALQVFGERPLTDFQAVMQTGSILEAMRANPGVDYTMAKQCNVPSAGASLLANDQREWMRALKNTIGSGEATDTTTCGQIACNAGVCTVTVFWNDIRAGADQGGAARNLQTSARI